MRIIVRMTFTDDRGLMMKEIIFDHSNVDDRDDESDLCLSAVTWTGPTAHTSTASSSGCFGTWDQSGQHHLDDHERSPKI